MYGYNCTYGRSLQTLHIYSDDNNSGEWLATVNLKTREIEWMVGVTRAGRLEIREFLGLLGCVVIDRNKVG